MTLFKSLFLGFLFIFSMNINATEHKAKKITTAPLKQILISKTYRLSADVEAVDQAKIASQINARIKKIQVLMGDKVTKNQLLIDLDCKDIQLAINVQKAQRNQQKVTLTYAKKQYDRAKRLAAKKSISIENKEQRESAWQQAKAMLEIQNALLKQSQANRAKCQIKAPFNGIVSQKMVSLGDYVTVGQPLLTLVGDDLEINAMLNNEEILSIKNANSLFFETQDQKYKVLIRQFIALLDPVTHQQPVRLLFMDKKPLSGTFGQLSWQTKKQYLPVKYMVRRNTQLGYFKLNQTKTKVIFKSQSHAIEGVPLKIEDNLLIDLVTSGLNNLQNNDAINIE